jgi:hypothetical protein
MESSTSISGNFEINRLKFHDFHLLQIQSLISSTYETVHTITERYRFSSIHI